jgi:hypothetical protein
MACAADAPESTIARYVRRFREQPPAPPAEREKQREARGAEFWWLKARDKQLEPTLQPDEASECPNATSKCPGQARSAATQLETIADLEVVPELQCSPRDNDSRVVHEVVHARPLSPRFISPAHDMDTRASIALRRAQSLLDSSLEASSPRCSSDSSSHTADAAEIILLDDEQRVIERAPSGSSSSSLVDDLNQQQNQQHQQAALTEAYEDPEETIRRLRQRLCVAERTSLSGLVDAAEERERAAAAAVSSAAAATPALPDDADVQLHQQQQQLCSTAAARSIYDDDAVTAEELVEQALASPVSCALSLESFLHSRVLASSEAAAPVIAAADCVDSLPAQQADAEYLQRISSSSSSSSSHSSSSSLSSSCNDLQHDHAGHAVDSGGAELTQLATDSSHVRAEAQQLHSISSPEHADTAAVRLDTSSEAAALPIAAAAVVAAAPLQQVITADHSCTDNYDSSSCSSSGDAQLSSADTAALLECHDFDSDPVVAALRSRLQQLYILLQ